MDFVLDDEIQHLLPPLTPEEKQQLRKELVDSEYCDPLIVLHILDENQRVLGDGYNRYWLCVEEGIQYTTRTIKVETRADAIQWVIDHQLGRRNLTDERKAYYRGKEYLNKKSEHGGDRASGQNVHLKTSEIVGEKYGVDEKTVRRDGAFAEAVDTLKPKARDAVLSGQATATKAEIATGIFCRPCRVGVPHANCKECRKLRKQKADEEAEKKNEGLPKHVATALADMWTFECVQILEEMATRAKTATLTWNKWLPFEVVGELKQCAQYFKAAIPDRLCPNCQGKKCADCHMTGWLPKAMKSC